MSKKKLSGTFIVSIGLHAALFVYLGNIVLDKVLPSGEVSTMQINFEQPQGATQIDVVKQVPEQKPVPKPEVKVKPVVALPPKIETAAPPVIEDQNSEISTETKPEETPEETKVADAELPPIPAPPIPAPPVPAPPSDVPPTDQSENAGGPPTEGVQSDAVLAPLAGNKKISYPYWARLRKQEGLTVVNYTVTPEGFVESVDVVKSSGHPFLDREVVNTIKDWKFKPMGRRGVYERPVQFSLKGDAEAAPSKLRTTK